jgi:colanic acid/amylovoran biosynthesis protein
MITIFNVYGSTNTGDAALISSCISILLTLGISESDINLICIDPEGESLYHNSHYNFYTRICNKRDFSNSFHFFIALAFTYFFAFTGIGEYLLSIVLPNSHYRSVQILKSSRISISCPGGYLEDSNGSYLVNILQILLASRLSSKVVLAPQSIGPIEKSLSRLILKYALLKVDKIFVRELYSFNFTNKLLPVSFRKNIILSGDLALLYDQKFVSSSNLTIDSSNYSVANLKWGMTIVDWKFKNNKNSSRLRSEYISFIHKISNYLFSLTGNAGILLNQVDADSNFCYSIANKSNSLIYQPSIQSFQNMIKTINNFDFFIGTRFHSCLFSLIAETPFLSINYLPKSSGILSQLMLSDLGFNIDNLVFDIFVERFNILLGNLPKESSRLAEAKKTYHDKYLNSYIEYIRSILS